MITDTSLLTPPQPDFSTAIQTFERLARMVNAITPDHSTMTITGVLYEINTTASLDPVQATWLRNRLFVRRDNELADLPDHDYVGPLNPQALLVGDTPGLAAPSYGAFTPWPNGCGMHLLNALVDVQVNVGRIGFVNSAATNLDDLYTVLGRSPRVVALGRTAARRLDKFEGMYLHGYAHHPQYEKRFRHHERHAYGLQLREGITAWTTKDYR